jgi:WD40 repeat protein
MSEPIPITTPLRKFKGHEGWVMAVAVLPDKRRMVTGSYDKTLRLWDLETGVMLKKMEGHRHGVRGLIVSRDGQLIASGDASGKVIVWHGETGELLAQPIQAHSSRITSLDFSPDGTALATGSRDKMKLWNTKTWQLQGNPITGKCGHVRCLQYSPSGKLLAIATNDNIQIYISGMREPVDIASFKAHAGINYSLAWMPDGTRLLTGGDKDDPTIREWDALTWHQVGDPWVGHTSTISAIVVNPNGTLVASASYDNHVRLWRLSDRQTIVIFTQHPPLTCISFSMDGKHIISGGVDEMISEWAVPNSKARFCP